MLMSKLLTFAHFILVPIGSPLLKDQHILIKASLNLEALRLKVRADSSDKLNGVCLQSLLISETIGTIKQ